MTAGQRDQRIRVFGFTNVDTDGWATSSYQYQGEYWGRIDSPTVREATVAGQGEHLADAVVTFHRDVPLSDNGLLKSVQDGRHYKITGIPPTQRTSGEKKVFAVYAGDSTFAITGEPNP